MSEQLQKKIETFLEGISLKSLLVSAKKISGEYRAFGKRDKRSKDDKELWAYLITRMPATYAALSRVFQELAQRMPGFNPDSLLDVGAGPATTLWAADAYFPHLSTVHLLEKDESFISLGKYLAEDLPLFPKAKWLNGDMIQNLPQEGSDLIVASYSLGEINEQEGQKIALKLWKLTKEVLIILEPGTPRGFERLRAIRSSLISSGAHLIAPCPHADTCPMSNGDWCHFYARLNRSSLHQKVKEADLNYEDEKFAYLIFSRQEARPAVSRILRHPRKGNGHVRLTLCTQQGVEDRIVTKKDREVYKSAKKKDWGDEL